MEFLPYYTRAGAARALNVSREAIRQAVLRGELTVAFTEDDFELIDLTSLAAYQEAMSRRPKGGKRLTGSKQPGEAVEGASPAPEKDLESATDAPSP
ncbi:MAG TPA: hypothetical protein PLU30_07055 [Verrucomicrobiae bacterium]|nr:hypothetical protein [Verrucomicrobiae bacterium]